MSGLTSFGIFHTAISLVAVGSGAIALLRDKKISWDKQVGKMYVFTTIVTCITGLGIFHHDGFGKPHVLSILTLIVLGIAFLAAQNEKPLGKFSPYIERVGYSMTFFFHLIPGFTEPLTRLPVEQPWASSPDDPNLQKIIGVCALLFLIGAVLQVRALKKQLAK
ncbi:MAG: hypothetical protein V4651_10390 [Bacteroidota bacterium]